MDKDDPIIASLQAPFDALRAELPALAAPAALEQALMAAYARQYPKARWYRRAAFWRWSLAGGAGSAAVAALVLLLSLHGAAPPVLDADSGALAARDAGVDFIALESRERIEQEPHARLVEAEVPRTMLDALGVPASPENAGDSVRAEMLVGADGAPLALRFLSKH